MQSSAGRKSNRRASSRRVGGLAHGLVLTRSGGAHSSARRTGQAFSMNVDAGIRDGAG